MYSITTSPTQQTLTDLLVTPASNSSHQSNTLPLNTPTQTAQPSPTMSPVTLHISVPLNQSIIMHCCIMHLCMPYSYSHAASQFKRNSNHTLTKVWTLMTSLLVTILRYFYIGQLVVGVVCGVLVIAVLIGSGVAGTYLILRRHYSNKR